MSKRRAVWTGIIAMFLGGVVGGSLTAFGLAGMLLGAQRAVAHARGKEKVAREVVTERLKIVDDTGKARAILDRTEGGVSIQLHDRNGEIRASLGVTEEGGGLVLYDDNGKMRTLLAALSDGPGLTFYDAKGRHRAGFFVPQEGPSLRLYDRNQKVRAALGVETPKTGSEQYRPESSAVLYSAKGAVMWEAP